MILKLDHENMVLDEIKELSIFSLDMINKI